MTEYTLQRVLLSISRLSLPMVYFLTRLPIFKLWPMFLVT